MRTLRSRENYVLIDHRDSPGVPEAMEVAIGLKPGSTRGKFECAVATCGHCQTQIMLRPDRSRERGYCRRCDHYICDGCNAVMAETLECNSIERQFEAALKTLEASKLPVHHLGFHAAIAPAQPSGETATVVTSAIILP